jgi:hypothetical protein
LLPSLLTLSTFEDDSYRCADLGDSKALRDLDIRETREKKNHDEIEGIPPSRFDQILSNQLSHYGKEAKDGR